MRVMWKEWTGTFASDNTPTTLVNAIAVEAALFREGQFEILSYEYERLAKIVELMLETLAPNQQDEILSTALPLWRRE